jgi:hypothetical protein
MDIKIPALPITVVNLHAHQPPRRLLEISCNISNPTSFDVCILDAWVKVEALGGLKIAEGKIFQTMHNRVDPAIIPRGKTGLGAFNITLPAAVLKCMEERRAGGDVKLWVSSRVLVSRVITVNDVKTLGVPFETQFTNGRSDRFEYLIPQSEWIKILKNLLWLELEVLEVPLSRICSIPSLARAVSRFEDAQECYRRGDWEESMLNCRKAFEAIVQDATGQSNMKNANQAFISIMGEGVKTNRLNELAKSLGDFLHLGRHENLPDITIKRADSELGLLLTGAILTYLGQQ